MKLFSSFILICLSAVLVNAEPNRLVINVERSEFKPLQEVSWRILAGSASFTRSQEGSSFSGSGLGVGIEKILNPKWTAGLHYTNVNGIRSQNYFAYESNEYRENMGALSGYGKYSFVNFPVNQWNLIQVNLLGGISVYDRYANNIQPVYGASASYNYDNLIGFEFGTRVNLKAESSTSANLIGYF